MTSDRKQLELPSLATRRVSETRSHVFDIDMHCLRLCVSVPRLCAGLLCRAMLILTLLSIVGCSDDPSGPAIDVSTVKHHLMPADGPKIPAPRGMTTGPDDSIYVLDNGGRVLVYSSDGEMQKSWHMPEYDVGRPEGICIFKDGRIAVADTHYHRVVFFDKDHTGKVESMLGKEGQGTTEFIWPVAVIQDDKENFYVSEYGGDNRVQKFSVDGKFLKQWGGNGTEPGKFQRPSGMVWHDGKIYTADAFNNRIQVFTDEGEFVGMLGGETDAPSLHYPYDITRSVGGDFYIVEYGANRVTKLNSEGRLLGRFGTTGGGDGQFLTPWGLTIDSKDRVWVADTGNRRIVELHQ